MFFHKVSDVVGKEQSPARQSLWQLTVCYGWLGAMQIAAGFCTRLSAAHAVALGTLRFCNLVILRLDAKCAPFKPAAHGLREDCRRFR